MDHSHHAGDRGPGKGGAGEYRDPVCGMVTTDPDAYAEIVRRIRSRGGQP